MKKILLGMCVAVLLSPVVTFANTQVTLEERRIALLQQIISLLEAQLASLQIEFEQRYGISGVVLGASTSVDEEEVSRPRRGGGGSSSSSGSVVVPVATSTATTTATSTAATTTASLVGEDLTLHFIGASVDPFNLGRSDVLLGTFVYDTLRTATSAAAQLKLDSDVHEHDFRVAAFGFDEVGTVPYDISHICQDFGFDQEKKNYTVINNGVVLETDGLDPQFRTWFEAEFAVNASNTFQMAASKETATAQVFTVTSLSISFKTADSSTQIHYREFDMTESLTMSVKFWQTADGYTAELQEVIYNAT